MPLAPTDYVRHFLFEELDIRGAFVRLTDSWQRLTAGRNYPAPVSRLLGEMTAVTLLIGASRKIPGRLTFQVRGDGPVGMLVIDCTDKLHFRGLARFDERASEAPTPHLLGDGKLVFTLEEPHAERPYQSVVPLNGGSLGEIFEHYISQSDQQDVHLWLSVTEHSVAGLLLQKLPDADKLDADGWARITQLAATLDHGELHDAPLVALLPKVFPDETMRVFDPRPATYECPFNREKVETMLVSLGQSECEALLKEHGEIVVNDDICNHTYRFNAAETRALFGRAAPPGPLH